MAEIIIHENDRSIQTRTYASDQPRSRLIPAAGRWLPDAMCLSVIAVVALAGFCTPSFAPDSWSLFELSNHVFDDFYRVNTVRQFQFDSLYGVSFPPLYPVLLAMARQVFDAGIYTGVFLNVGIAVLTLWQFKRLAIVIGLPTWAGNAWMLLLLANSDYDSELVSAGTFPLAVMLMIVLLRRFIEADRSEPANRASSTLTMGIVAGLLCLTRFDFLLVAIALGLIAWLILGDWSVKRGFIYYAALAVVLSPWCWYSLSHFDKPFVSDNSRTVLTAERTYVMDYFDADNPPPTVFNQPIIWAKTLVVKRLPPVIGAALSMLFNYFPIMLLGGMLLGLALGRDRAGQLFRRDRTTTLLIWFGVALGAQLLAVSLTGYRDRRYFIPLVCYGTIVAIYFILRHHTVADRLPVIRRWALPLLTLLTIGHYVREVDFKPVLANFPPRFDPRLTNAAQYQALTQHLDANSPQPRLLVLPGNLEPFRFGALTGYITIPAPSNLSGDNVRSFINRYGVTHLLDADDVIVPELRAKVTATATNYPGLYKIHNNTEQSSLIEPVIGN